MNQPCGSNKNPMTKISDLKFLECKKIQEKVKDPIILNLCGNQISVQIRLGLEQCPTVGEFPRKVVF